MHCGTSLAFTLICRRTTSAPHFLPCYFWELCLVSEWTERWGGYKLGREWEGMKREGRIQSYSVKEEILGVIKAAGKKRLSAYKETQPAGHRVPKNSGFAILEIQVLCTQVSRNKNDKERGPSPVSLSCTCPTENCARSRFPPFGNSATNTKP